MVSPLRPLRWSRYPRPPAALVHRHLSLRLARLRPLTMLSSRVAQTRPTDLYFDKKLTRILPVSIPYHVLNYCTHREAPFGVGDGRGENLYGRRTPIAEEENICNFIEITSTRIGHGKNGLSSCAPPQSISSPFISHNSHRQRVASLN